MNQNLTDDIRDLTQKLSQLSPEERAFLNPQLEQLTALCEFEDKNYNDLLDRYNLAIKGTNDGIWDWDLNTDTVVFSARWMEILGHEKDALPNKFKTWEDNVHPDDLEMALKPVKDYLSGKTTQLGETVYSMKLKSGEYIYTAHRGFAQFNAEGKPTRLVGTMRNVDEEVKTKVELLGQNKFINSIFDSSPHLLFVKDTKGRFIKVNRAVGKLFDKDPSELEYQYNDQVHDKEDELDTFDRIEREVRDTLKTVTLEEKFTDFRNKELWFQTVKTPILNSNGEVNVLGISTDITHLKQTQKALEVKEREYRDLVNSLSAVVYRKDNDGNYTFLNPAWENLLHHSIEKSIGKNGYSFLHPADAKALKNEKDKLYSKEIDSIVLQVRVRTKLGSYRNMEASARLQYDENGNIMGTQGILVDIHENVLYAEELKTRQAIFKTISDNSKDMIALHNKDASFRFVSPSAVNLLGFSQEELLQINPFDLYHPDDVDNIEKILNDFVLKQSDFGSTEFRMRRKTGEYIWVESNASIITNDYGEIIMIQTSTRDISQRKEIEQQRLENIEREKELSLLRNNFVSMASHQFRTPLTIMRSNLDIVEVQLQRKREINIEVFKKVSNRVNNEISNMVSLMDDILILGKLDAGQTQLILEPTNVVAFIQGIIKDRFGDNSSAVGIGFTAKRKSIKSSIDKGLMLQVFENVIQNALKYSEGEKPPQVTVDSENGYCRVIVKDYGIGIPQKDIGRIFESFFRAGNSTKYQGTGLGLSIVKQFVGLHQGKVTVNSELGEFTEVIIDLKLE